MPLNTSRKNGFYFFIIAVLCVASLASYVNKLGIETYQLSDWLINYEGGFVRRGLIGEALYIATQTSNQLLWGLFLLQVAFFFCIGYLIYLSFAATQKSKEWLLILFSPAFVFTFFISDADYGMRKEMLVYLSMMLLIVGLIKEKINIKLLTCAVFTYFIAALSHEIASLCAPFLLYPLWKRSQIHPENDNICRQYSYLFCIIAFLGILTALFFPGSEVTKELICKSWVDRGVSPKMCGYSLFFYGLTSKVMFEYLQHQIHSKPYISLYLLCFLLSIIPIALSNWWKNRDAKLILVIGGIAILPLFLLGIDWGRWIYIYTTLVFMCVIYDDAHSKVHFHKVPAILIIAYCITWTLPITVYRPQGLLSPFYSGAPNLGIFDRVFLLYAQPSAVDIDSKEDWISILANYQKIIFYPLQKNSVTQNQLIKIAIDNDLRFNASRINWYGTFPWLTHYSSYTLNRENESERARIEKQELDQRALYVFDFQGAFEFIKNNNFDKFNTNIYRLDGKYLFLPKALSCNPCEKSGNLKMVDPKLMLYPYTRTISFTKSDDGQNPLLIEGWTQISEEWGTWSNSKRVRLTIPIPEGNYEKLKLHLRALVNPENPIQKLIISQNGQRMEPIFLTHFQDNAVEININNLSKIDGLVHLEIELPNARSPTDIGLGKDSRLLGIGLQNAEWVN